jgi:hypothetical protein
MATNTTSITAQSTVQRPAPAARAEAVKVSETARLAEIESNKRRQAEAQTQPVINTQGQTPGRLLNVRA